VIREIVMYGSKVLRRKADAVGGVNAATQSLIQDLFDSLEEADGVGLAAPQIGVSQRVIVVDVSTSEKDIPPLALIDPRITLGEGMSIAEEGCLSIPEQYGDVKRYTNIEVEALDRDGAPFKFSAEGFYARVLQHEIDHLDGILFVDNISSLKRQLLRGALKRLKKEGETWDRRHLPVG
jgi:peptide deformylase